MFARINFTMKYISAFVAVLFLASCGSETTEDKTATEEDNAQEDTTKIYSSNVLESASRVFYAMPSPMEVSGMIKATGDEYQAALLHDPMKANTYQSTQKRALALGVYGADLSYTAVYDRQSEALKYLAASKRIGESIGIHEAFRADIIERANANLANKDSMLAIMTQMYWESNSQLDEENREQIALLVMAGGWLEGLYIACNINEELKDPGLKDRIAEQKFAADQLTEMFIEYQDDYMVEEAYSWFKPLLDHFKALDVESSDASLSKNEETGMHTIGGKTTVNLPMETLTKIKEETFSLRQKLIEP
ncbi:MAG: hypothetical protein Salg2KO_02760 [Salibacteraceae bacterium]